MMVQTVFLIPAKNSQDTIEDCIESIFEADKNALVYVLNDASEDKTIFHVLIEETKHENRVFLINNHKWQGTSKSRNRLLDMVLSSGLDFDYLCYLDADTKINKVALDAMIEECKKDPDAICGCKQINENGAVNAYPPFPTFSSKTRRLLKLPTKNTDSKHYLISACLLMRKGIAARLWWDENVAYAPEDVIWCADALKEGYKLKFLDDVSIYHKHRQSWKKSPKFFLMHVTGLLYYFTKEKAWITPQFN